MMKTKSPKKKMFQLTPRTKLRSWLVLQQNHKTLRLQLRKKMMMTMMTMTETKRMMMNQTAPRLETSARVAQRVETGSGSRVMAKAKEMAKEKVRAKAKEMAKEKVR